MDRAYDQHGEYDEYDADFINAFLNLHHVYINIYTDASGNNFEIDSKGNAIQNRLIYFYTYTLPYTDPVSGLPKRGFLRLHFSDGSYYDNPDTNIPPAWYAFTGLEPFTISFLT